MTINVEQLLVGILLVVIGFGLLYAFLRDWFPYHKITKIVTKIADFITITIVSLTIISLLVMGVIAIIRSFGG